MKKIYIFSSVLLLSGMAFAQSVTILPQGNPKIMRLHPETFTVNLRNDNPDNSVNNLTLEAAVSAGFTITPTEFSGINIPADGTVSLHFTVTPNCTAPQAGGKIAYTLKNGGGTVLGTASTTSITITESDFIFVKPADYVADVVSNIFTYSRIWTITQSAPQSAVSNVRVTNTCNKSAFEIVAVEVVDDMYGTSVLLDITSLPNFDPSQPNKYVYNLDSVIFKMYGNNNTVFDTHETVYIREIFKVKTCTSEPSASAYSIEYGDGTNYCHDSNSGVAYTSVASPLNYYNSIGAVTINPVTSIGMGGIGTGKFRYTIRNTSTDYRSVFRNTYLALTIWSARQTITRAYLSDAAGNPLPGFPDLVLSPDPSAPTNPLRKIIYFDGFTASNYADAGFINHDGDGIWNDIPPDGTINISFEFEIDLTKGTSCAAAVVADQLAFTPYYYTNCNVSNYINTSYLAGAFISYGAPTQVELNPPNVSAGTVTTLSFTQVTPDGNGNRGWGLSVSDYDHYVLITLPEGFDYDLASSGFRINGIACALIDVSKDLNGSGRVVVTAHNRVANHSSSISISVDMVALSGITNSMDKSFRVEHEFAFKDEAQHFKFACYNTTPDFMVHPTEGCIHHLDFTAQRMTFGWTDYNHTTRLTLANLGSYPPINRSVAGPYDNVNFASPMLMTCDTMPYTSNDWFVYLDYDAPRAGGCFIFPDTAKAVEILRINESGDLHVFYIPQSRLTISNSGLHYTLAANITPYTLTCHPDSVRNMHKDDIVLVTFKMQTTENMPNVLTKITNLTMKNYLLGSNPDDYSIWMKNFWVVDYAVRSFGGPVGDITYNENVTNNKIINNTVPGVNMSASRIFPNEYRPDQYATRYEITYKRLWNITAPSVTEFQYNDANPGNPTGTYPTLTPSDYTVTHSGGQTSVVITKQLQSNMTLARALFHWYSGGYPYCAIHDTVLSAKVNYLYYPSSERNDITGEFTLSNYRAYNARNYYTTTLTATSPVSNPGTNNVSWNFTLTNTSSWATTDRILPNSWLSVTVPPDVTPLSLTDGSNTWTFTSYGSGSGKYWVKLGNLNLAGTTVKNFTLSCTYTSCEAFDIELNFSQSKIGYPDNPASMNFGIPGAITCPNVSSLALRAVPVLSSLRGTVTNPPYDGITGYTFCNPHTFKATFTNTNVSDVLAPVLELQLGKGLELPVDSVRVTQNGLPVTVQSISDSGPGNERTAVIMLDPATVLPPFGTAGYEIEVSFALKPGCGFGNGYVVYLTFKGTNRCGKSFEEKKNTVPLMVDGLFSQSDYLIPNFGAVSTSISGGLDFRNATEAAASKINVTATIELNTSSQTTGDFVAISIPPNMSIASNNTLTFDFWKTENGNSVYKDTMPHLVLHGTTFVDVTLTPVNLQLWDCEDVTVSLFTGVSIPLTCDAAVCDVYVKHDNEEKETFHVFKNTVNFLAGSVSGAGVYAAANSENVRFSGTLTVPANSDMQNLVIEVFSNRSGALQPVGVSFTIPSVITDASTTAFPFVSPTALTIPAAEMCHLYLVIRKTSTFNLYICDSVATPVSPPSYTLTTQNYTACQNEEISIGDPAIAGYSYEWTLPADVTSAKLDTTPIKVLCVPPAAGDKYLNLTVRRGGCNVSTTARIRIAPQADASYITTENDTVCYGETSTLTPEINAIISNPVLHWYSSQTAPTPFFTGFSYTTSALTADVTFYLGIESDNYCKTQPGTRKAVRVKVNSCFNLDCTDLIDRVVDEDGYGLGYTHTTTTWDISPSVMIRLDSVQYFKDNLLYSSGKTASLIGAYFPVGVSTVTVVSYSIAGEDTCEFKVTVNQVCPASVDDFEGYTYNVIPLAGLCWTTNLRSTIYSSDGSTPITFAKPYYSSLYHDTNYNTNIFGLLYTWYSAVHVPESSTVAPVPDANGFVQGICPNGFHVPSQAEWARLEPYPSSQLRSTQYWLNPPGPGTDDYNFDARPAGWYNGAIDQYQDLYGFTGWWAAEDSGSGGSSSYFRITYYCNVIETFTMNKNDALSVRCVMDY